MNTQEVKSITELTVGEIETLKALATNAGWDIFVSIVNGILANDRADIIELERNPFEKMNGYKIGTLRQRIDLCEKLINIPNMKADVVDDDMGKSLEVY